MKPGGIEAYVIAMKGLELTMEATTAPAGLCLLPSDAVDRIMAGDTVTVSREDAMQVCRDLDALLFFVQRHKAGFVDSAGNKWRPEA